jgi:hypothetical protein
MTFRCRTAILAAAVAIGPAAATAAAAAPVGGPAPREVVADKARYGPDAVVCSVGTANFRIWWDDRVGSPDAPKGVDGRCDTLPDTVRRLAGVVERIRRSELALGFPPAPSDRATDRNGGDARHDVYIHRTSSRGETGAEWCMYLSRGRSIIRSFSYTVLSNHVPAGDPLQQALEETFAHEYFHGIQCRIVPRIGTIPAWIAEGTANWMAASVTGAAFEASPFHLGNLLSRLAAAAAGDTPVTRQGYDAWGLWYSLTKAGTDGGPVRRLLTRLRKDPTDPVAALAASTADLPGVLRDFAVDIRRGGDLAGTTLPDSYVRVLPLVHPVKTLDLQADGADVNLAPLEYTYRRVVWPAGSAIVSVRIAGGAPLAASVALAVDGTTVDVVPIASGDDLEFRVPTGGVAGSALLVVASARRGAITVTPSARLVGAVAAIRPALG